MWLYMQAGGARKPLGKENSVVDDAVELMLTNDWWGAAEERFGVKKQLVTTEYVKECVRKSSSHNKDATLWVKIVWNLHAEINNVREEQRDQQEKFHAETRQLVDSQGKQLNSQEK